MTPAPAAIAAATPADVPALMRLIRQLAEYERLLDQVVATEADLARALFGPVRAAEAILARVDGRAVGFALFFHNYSTFVGKPGMYLEDLFVEPAARGRGIGKALFLHVARLAHARGCGRFEWSVLDWNQPAIDFYRGMGAVPMDEWTVFRLSEPALAKLVE